MAREYFKTTQRQRTSAQQTRQRRVAVGRPQPNLVDEAISAAVKSRLVAWKTEGDVPVAPSKVLDGIMADALRHLVDTRGQDRQQSQIAVQARLTKRRKYKTLVAPKA